MGPGGKRGDEGFTLLELMVVVLVIAVLLGIALPSYLGAREKSNDRVVASNVRTAFAAARVYYAEDRQYTADPDEMREIEPSLDWTNDPLDGVGPPSTIYIEVQDFPTAAQTVVVVGRSRSGKCYYLRDVMSGADAGTFYEAQVPDGANCSVPLLNDPGWTSSWQG